MFAFVPSIRLHRRIVFAVLALGAIGIIRAGSRDERAVLCTVAAVGLGLAILHALAYVEGRHRWGIGGTELNEKHADQGTHTLILGARRPSSVS